MSAEGARTAWLYCCVCPGAERRRARCQVLVCVCVRACVRTCVCVWIPAVITTIGTAWNLFLRGWQRNGINSSGARARYKPGLHTAGWCSGPREYLRSGPGRMRGRHRGRLLRGRGHDEWRARGARGRLHQQGELGRACDGAAKLTLAAVSCSRGNEWMNEANDAFPARSGGTTKTYAVPQYNHCAPSVPDTTHDRLCGNCFCWR